MVQQTHLLPGGWVVRRKPLPAPRLRLFCFPRAGGGAGLFRTWTDALPQGVELCAVRLPGRESRLREPPFTHLSNLLPAVFDALGPLLDVPFAFFGHSLGGLVSFELTRYLRAHRATGPFHLFVAARRAPHRPEPEPPIHRLPDPDFVDAVRRRFRGIPDVVLRESELMELLLPTLRADFALLETYIYTRQEPLSCPITCFGGVEDPETSHEDLAAWHEHTRGPFEVFMLPGDHFFLNGARSALLRILSERLVRTLGANAR